MKLHDGMKTAWRISCWSWMLSGAAALVVLCFSTPFNPPTSTDIHAIEKQRDQAFALMMKYKLDREKGK